MNYIRDLSPRERARRSEMALEAHPVVRRKAKRGRRDAVSGVENIGQCGRLSQLSWLLGVF